jgi:uroporphyrinogen decarboxylase
METADTVFLKACKGQSVPHTPIWLMRQAGRYMKEYRDIRARVSFLELCRSPELVCEVTTFACRKINADAAIIFADILLIAEAIGFNLEFAKDHGPRIHNPFRTEKDLARIDPAGISEKLSYVFKAITLTRKELEPKYSLIGFAGAPFTVATYIIEGGKSKDFVHIKNLMKTNPKAWNGLMTALTNATIEYLNGQVKAGADSLQIFDSWIGILSVDEYQTHVAPYMKKLFAGLPKEVPVIHFGTKTKHLLKQMRTAGGTIQGLDTDVLISQYWPQINYAPIQGNLAPEVLLEDFSIVKKEAQKILDQVNGRPGFIFNLGHGIVPATPVDNVVKLIEYVHTATQR